MNIMYHSFKGISGITFNNRLHFNIFVLFICFYYPSYATLLLNKYRQVKFYVKVLCEMDITLRFT